MSLRIFAAAGLALAAVLPLQAVADTAAVDSTVTTVLPELVVSGEAAAPPVPGHARISEVEVSLQDPATLADLGALLPSARVSTNSRGDRHLMIRGAPERHVQTFLDGIPLNLPWDERTDLESIPITGVGRIEGRRGLPSLLDGPGVLAGSVRILPPRRVGDQPYTRVNASLGDGGQVRAGLLHQRTSGDWNLLGGGNWSRRDEWPLPESGDPRFNSDAEQGAILLRGSRAVAGTGRLNLLASGWSGEKGVPPEMHLGEDARFWRYPVRKRALLGGSVAMPLGDGDWDLSAMLAADIFRQEIDPRGPDGWDADPVDGEDYETGLNRTSHVQLGLTRWLGQTGRVSFQGSTRYAHHQESLVWNGPELGYAQWLTALVAEGEYQPSGGWKVRVGAGYDFTSTPQSGDKPASEGFDAPALNLRLSREVDEAEFYVAASRRSRFPSLRELYSGALGKFVPNPDLRPEQQDLYELGLTADGQAWRLSTAAFLQYLHDGIEKVAISGTNQFQRVNRTEIRLPGLEVAFTWRAHPEVDLTLQHTVMSARVQENGNYDRPAEDRPDYLSRFGISWQSFNGPGAAIDASVVGARWSADSTNADTGLRRLPAGVTWNGRLSWRWDRRDQGGLNTEAHLRVDNLFDQWVDYQTGLPGPGRVFSGGLSVGF